MQRLKRELQEKDQEVASLMRALTSGKTDVTSGDILVKNLKDEVDYLKNVHAQEVDGLRHQIEDREKRIADLQSALSTPSSGTATDEIIRLRGQLL